ncbi:DUF6572 domain-containing protein [Pedobacter fastidiosus]|uniref:Uncharacterized protein n=1 Tax=Pedobacter fastidiosus TaxID=2765361 RepID=A0ABR7KRF4_9SPHI|nr:DUF6572 domain-containing protein [Pedobacter fastidiosus]MBC6110685.1 hypothetical protein [Pedobacter fastidiosus]
MSVIQVDKIDFIGIDGKTKKVALTISDHLDWDDEYYHLSVLQEKINAYLRFIESGEIYDVYPDSVDRR